MAQAKRSGTWIVIAAYNEAPRIAEVIRRTRASGYRYIVVVDDGSKDQTALRAQKAGALVLRHVVNLGKGAALKTGADIAVERGATQLVFIDGDGQHRPEEIPIVLERLQGKTDIVFTYRKDAKKAPLIRRAGGIAISTLVRLFYNLHVRDALCGMRAMTADAYRRIRWTSAGYSVEAEMIANTGINFLHADEAAISTIYHDNYKGMTIFDGIRTLWHLVAWRMTR